MLCARGVRDSIISEQLGVALAVHQDDFSGLTCIGYRIFFLGAVRPRAAHNIIPKSAKKGTQRAQRTPRCAELVWWLAWWFWVIRQRLLLAVVALVGAMPTANR